MLLGLGRLPQKSWKRREESSEYFDEDGEFLSDSERVQGPFPPNRLAKFECGGINEEEEQASEELVRRMIKYEPGERSV
ncbi:hypothetical protein K443DRAFT_676934 [Laccaria amethystina LaAM-08-1]|uniref:Uncharacterized protein n=1 Tax=Laccaria amethystina LaAM-08-1 TaxID=1095629 RepID=A0A0C9XEC1_9AGAR|nr:hypothetical protein K443DRAFT_676934 [Laccaria amethystina LaAM-08-1]